MAGEEDNSWLNEGDPIVQEERDCLNDFYVAEAVTNEEALSRIEELVKDTLQGIMDDPPKLIPFTMIDRSSKNAEVCQLTDRARPLATLLLRGSTCLRTFSSNGTAFVRVWKVLEFIYNLLSQSKRATQREIYYCLISECPELFPHQRHLNDTIQDIVAILRCTRDSLGVLTASRGAVAGLCHIKEPYKPGWTDCTHLGLGGLCIPGDISTINAFRFRADARYIIVVEKDAIFQRLSEDRFFLKLPSIILTAKGFPDLATRTLLRRLHDAFPDLPVVALVDWNPAGLSIVCTYKYGSVRMGLETASHACDVKWLGVRSSDLALVPEEATQPLSARNQRLATSMLSSPAIQGNNAYREELEKMLQLQCEIEIEALYAHRDGFLGRYIAEKIVRQDYI